MSSLAWQLSSWLVPVLTFFACVLLGLVNCKAKKQKPPVESVMQPVTNVVSVVPAKAAKEEPAAPKAAKEEPEAPQAAKEEKAAPGKPAEKKPNDDKKKEDANKKPQDCEPKAAVPSILGQPKGDDPAKSNPILTNPFVTVVTEAEDATVRKDAKKPNDDKHGSALMEGRTQTEAESTQQC
ncbi:hypothetical protein AAVH_09281 [Aphelenchoides avenae]|nr:hypothetical protein AAVH_09281 [Aphelenchus avenae]